MHAESFLAQAFVYLVAAVLTVPLAKRLGLGSVLGYLVAGIAIGPFGLGLIGAEGADVMHFAEFGVVMMLFIVGLELDPHELWSQRGTLLGLGGGQVLGTAVVLAGVGIAAGAPWREAVAAGLILAMSSTAIVLQSLAERGLMRTDAGQRAFAVLLFQDLAVIPILALLPLLAGTTPAEATEATRHGIAALPGWLRALATLGAVATVVVAGRLLATPLFRFVARTRLREVFTATTLALVIGIALLMQAVGLSPALGTFLAGVVLASSEFRHELEGDLEPFKGLLLGVFFIAVGASVNFALVGANLGTVAVVVVGLLALKAAVLWALGGMVRLAAEPRLLFALALAQGGEFCFVLLSFAAQNGVLGTERAGLLVAAVALSMAATPLLLLLHERVFAPRLAIPRGPAGDPEAIDVEAPVIIAGFGDFGNTIGRFLRGHGFPVAVLELDSDRVALLNRMGLEVHYGDASREELLRAAGAAEARILVIAVDEPEQVQAIARTARAHFPHLAIMARANGRLPGQDLLNLGLTHVYRETLDSALHLARDAAVMLGMRAHHAHRAAQLFRRHDEESWRSMAALRKAGDQDAYISRARERIKDLERQLGDARTQFVESDDTAWDVETLRQEFGQRPPTP